MALSMLLMYNNHNDKRIVKFNEGGKPVRLCIRIRDLGVNRYLRPTVPFGTGDLDLKAILGGSRPATAMPC